MNRVVAKYPAQRSFWIKPSSQNSQGRQHAEVDKDTWTSHAKSSQECTRRGTNKQIEWILQFHNSNVLRCVLKSILMSPRYTGGSCSATFYVNWLLDVLSTTHPCEMSKQPFGTYGIVQPDPMSRQSPCYYSQESGYDLSHWFHKQLQST